MLGTTVSSHALLLVDADDAVHQALGEALAPGDLRIEHSFDGGEALGRLRASDYDLLVAGPGRNGVDGLELLRRARALRANLKVIVTGEADAARVAEAIRNRAYSYFHRPAAAPALADMVRYALESTSWKDDIRAISARPEWVTLSVRCRMEAAERTTQFLRELFAGAPAAAREDAAVAFRELLLNGIEHGGRNNPKKRVRVSMLRTARALMVQIHDPGKGFSTGMLPHAAISNPEGDPTRHAELRAAAGRRPGGFGILMSRSLVDELLYNERGNAVMFVKYLEPGVGD